MNRPTTRRTGIVLALLLAVAATLAATTAAQAADDTQSLRGDTYLPDQPTLVSSCPRNTAPVGLRVSSDGALTYLVALATSVRVLCLNSVGKIAPASGVDVITANDPLTENLLCPKGTRLAGINAFIGSVVDRVGPECIETRKMGRVSLDPSRGIGGYRFEVFQCPGKAVLTTITTERREFGGVPETIGAVNGTCRVPTTLEQWSFSLGNLLRR